VERREASIRSVLLLSEGRWCIQGSFFWEASMRVLLLSEGRGDHCHDESFVWRKNLTIRRRNRSRLWRREGKLWRSIREGKQWERACVGL
jgi:hypothetical protein